MENLLSSAVHDPSFEVGGSHVIFSILSRLGARHQFSNRHCDVEI